MEKLIRKKVLQYSETFIVQHQNIRSVPVADSKAPGEEPIVFEPYHYGGPKQLIPAELLEKCGIVMPLPASEHQIDLL